jgi:serine/threonine protein kinase
LSRNPHPHIAKLLATFEHKGKSAMILVWADSDLYEYWKCKNRNPALDVETARWVSGQCVGIADGLSLLHYFKNGGPSIGPTRRYGRHGDLKPQNILWFQNSTLANDRGVLKISDFGISEFHSEDSRSGFQNGFSVGHSRSYRPPEADTGAFVSRSYDIWTLGCLYIEFAAWLIGGWSLVSRFAVARKAPGLKTEVHEDTFFEASESKGVDNTAVITARIKPVVLHVSSDSSLLFAFLGRLCSPGEVY